MHIRHFFLCVTVFCLPATAFSQIIFRSLPEIWHFADDRNITLKLATSGYQKSIYSKQATYGAILPQVSVMGSATDNTSLQTTLLPAQIFGGPAGVYRPVQFGQTYIYSGGYNIQLDLLNLQSILNVRIAEESRKLSLDSLNNNKITIYRQLATQYYSYLLMREAAELAEKSASIADSVVFSVQNKFQKGLVNEGNLDVAKMNAERAKQTLITSHYQILTAANNLKALLNLGAADSIVLTEKLQDGIQIIPEDNFHEDPSVVIAKHQANMSIYQYKLTKCAFMPVVSLVYSNSSQQNDNKFEPVDAGGPKWYPASYWQLKASWQLFSGGSRYFQTKRAKISAYEKALLFENSQKQADINDANLKLTYKKAVELVGNSKNVMNLSFDNYSHVSNRYREGLAAIDERLNAFSDYINYQNQYLNNLSDLLVQVYLIKVRQLSY